MTDWDSIPTWRRPHWTPADEVLHRGAYWHEEWALRRMNYTLYKVKEPQPNDPNLPWHQYGRRG